MKVRKHSTESIINKKIDRLTPIAHYVGRAQSGRSCHFWTCKCDCGNVIERREQHLMNGRRQSCGCGWVGRCKGPQNEKWTGCGEISGTYFAEIRLNARGKDFTITIEEIWELFLKQDRKCALTGIPLHFPFSRHRDTRQEQNASLDRIDSTKGYTPDNVWWVHKSVNRMKNAFSLEQFVWVCHEVARRFTQDDAVDLDKEVKSTSATKRKRKPKQKPTDQLLAA